MAATQAHPLQKAIKRLLRPLVRLMIRHGIPYGEFKDMARQAYVDVGTQEFTLPGKKQSLSRISVLTGINRKDVAALQKTPDAESRSSPKHHNRAYRVINGWLVDRDFLDADGNCKALPIESDDDQPDFSELVRRHSGDVPVKAILDELTRIKAVALDDNLVHLIEKAYVPENEDSFRIFGQACFDLLSTLENNLNPDAASGRIQRSVAYDDIPLAHLDKIRERSEAEIQQLLLHINSWLSQYDRGVNSAIEGEGRVRAGVGLYYFEEPADPENEQEPGNAIVPETENVSETEKLTETEKVPGQKQEPENKT